MAIARPTGVDTSPALASAADTTIAAAASPGMSQGRTASNASRTETEEVPLRVFGPFGREAVAMKRVNSARAALYPSVPGGASRARSAVSRQVFQLAELVEDDSAPLLADEALLLEAAEDGVHLPQAARRQLRDRVLGDA